jgi:hypothetical protein
LLADSSPWLISNANCCMSRNSPWTRSATIRSVRRSRKVS